ncbi:PKD domain-containing protein [uncultured Methanolobus sp.]|uniref:PKD domain-containing protein n=1 Tax=uncultured Methanolobus sp. TaxID=218300 RepID=UPI002AAA998A|nr:PKD domain-containing protein [uncultured Methanolobus sp.]
MTLFMGTASAVAAADPEPTVSVDVSGPYSMNMGNELTLYTTVTITDLPSEWYDVYSDPDQYVMATGGFQWDLSGDGVYDNTELDVIDIRLNESTVTLIMESEIKTGYFANHETGVYDIEVLAIVSIEGGLDGENEGSLIMFETGEMYDATTIEVINPIIADAGGPYSGMTGSPVAFDGSGSRDTRELTPASIGINMVPVSEYGIRSHEWDFDGDGEYDDARGANALYVFTEPGTYKVSLKVTSWDGIVDIDNATVEIGAANPLVIDIGGPYSGIAGNPVTLDATGSHDTRQFLHPESASIFMIAKASPVIGIEYYLWDLNNDGTYDDAQGSVVQHTFATTGSHQVGLKIISYDGFEKTDCTTVEIKGSSSNEVPEFPTIALPIAAIIGLAFVMQRRKD